MNKNPLINPYAPFLSKIEKPARYIGGEHFLIRKEFTPEITKVALCFPEVYEIGMSHLGFKILYQELNQETDILAERCFAPWIDLEHILRTENLPLVSLENFRPLSNFDLVGFSLQFEMTYTNILNMLELGRIPLWQKDRDENDPLVIVGGPCATHPEPLAPFVDLILVGDAEGILVKLVRFIKEQKQLKVARQDILSNVANHFPAVYVPSLKRPHDQITRHITYDLKNRPFPINAPIPHATAIFDKFSMEISRGCTEGCRFCQAGIIYRPVRERDPKDIITSIIKGMDNGGFQEASLTCLSTADYSAVTPLIVDLLEKLKSEKATLSIASLRAYGLSEEALNKMAEVQNTSLTFAPEAGSQRMRDIINKNITEENILTTAERIFSRGWSKMKLYFMIGLPFETDDDVRAIMELGKKIREVALRLRVRRPEITISVSSFVPKPHTPFQWSEMISLEEIRRKQEILFQLAKEYKLNFRKHFSKLSVLEGVFARGGQEIASVLFDAFKSGARFDGWEECFKYDLWLQAMSNHGLHVESYHSAIDETKDLPWDHINVGVTKDFLLQEWKKAQKLRVSPPCGKPIGQLVHYTNLFDHKMAYQEEKKKIVCYHCGVKCDLTQMVQEREDFLVSLKEMNTEQSTTPMKEKRGQFVGMTYRLTFRKLGPLTFISHLDLQKVVGRIFKRAQLETLFSEGYRLKALLSFGPALPLGINSLCEFIDLRSPVEWNDFDAILDKLNQNSEKGIIFKNIETIERSTDSIQESIIAFEYFIPLASHDRHSLKLKELSESSELIVSSFSKKDQRDISKNIRPMIIDMQVSSPLQLPEAELDLIEEITPCKNKWGVHLKVSVNKGSSVRPSELLSLLNSHAIPCQSIIKLNAEMK